MAGIMFKMKKVVFDSGLEELIFINMFQIYKSIFLGHLGAQLVQCLTLGFSSGDLMGHGMERHMGTRAQRGVCLKILSSPIYVCMCLFSQINK